MELPDAPDDNLYQVSTRSSTRNRKGRKKRSADAVRAREVRIPHRTPDSSDQPEESEGESTPGKAEFEKGVGTSGVIPDISPEVARAVLLDQEPPDRRVRFDDQPRFIQSDPSIRVDEYDILQDIRQQKANVSIGQLLHDNANYQRQLKNSLSRPRKRTIKLPSVAVNFAEIEDFGAPEISVEIEGCTIRNVPVDGGSGVNLILETTAADLGFTTFEPTNQTLRMADQSRVTPVGRLSGIPTNISGLSYNLNYLVIRVGEGRPFPLLLGRPWLYLAGVRVNWAKKAFMFGEPAVSLSWRPEAYQGETDHSEGYTSNWSDPEASDSVQSYQVQQFRELTEKDLGFARPTPERGVIFEHQGNSSSSEEKDDGVSLGESNVGISIPWIRAQLSAGQLPPVPSGPSTLSPSWAELSTDERQDEVDRVKDVVSPEDYEAVQLSEGKTFFLGNQLSKTEQSEYLRLLGEYEDVFAWQPSDLVGIPPDLGEHHIDLVEGAIPVRQRQYRLNPKYSMLVKEELEKLLEAGFIYPVINSEWVSPIVIVPKKVGTDGKVKIRVCQDFRKLNAATKKDHFPLPFIDMVLDHVAGQECFSFLDGFSGYNQVSIRGEDQLKTTFTTDWGTYAFNRMPFGLCNAPGTFQRLMTDIFRDFLKHFLEVFIDDFAVFSPKESHLGCLRKTFQRCRETQLKLHPGKCFFGMASGLLLGHVVSREGIAVDLGKILVMLALLPPKNLREVRGFLGCVGYYRRFIEGYARMAMPLTELLKKDTPYAWTEIRQAAFEALKKRLVMAPILAAPDWEREFHVTVDASGWCLGAVLWQEDDERRERPIYYASRQMNPAEINYTTTEREALAMIYACKKFRHYLLGYKVIFHTDHDALRYLVNKPDLSGRLARWILLLQEFTYEVRFKPGRANANADFLSRQRGVPSSKELRAEFPDEFPDAEDFPRDIRSMGLRTSSTTYQVGKEDDPEFQKIRRYLETHSYPGDLTREEKSVFQHKAAPYSVIQGVLFRMGADDRLRRCVEPEFRQRVIRSLHDGPAGGHFAAVTTVERIRAAGYWWPTMTRDARLFIQDCDPCQRTGNPTFRNHWPLTTILPIAPFEKWGVDFIGPFQPLGGHRKRYIILATDYATKWVEARATRKNDAETSAKFIFERIMMRFGHPLELVSDRGTHFLNEVVADLTGRYNVKHRKTTPYNPKANGLTERANGIVCKILTKVVAAHKTDWDQKLCSAVYAYNTAFKSTTGKSPYFLVFGQEVLQAIETDVETFRILAARQATRSDDPETRLGEIDGLMECRSEALERTRAVQGLRKERYDQKLPKANGVTKGSLVLLYDSRHKDFPGKLHTRWLGPFKVSEVYGNGSLQLETLLGQPLDTRVNGSRVKLYRSTKEMESVRGDAHG